MNIDKLYVGLTFKNYKEFCIAMGIPVKTSTNSRKAQFKELERYCTYIKQGQKITITEIFAQPLDKIDHRKDIDKEGNNSKYVEHVKVLLLHKLSKAEGHKYTILKNRLFESLGMVNPQYLDKELFIKYLLKKDNRFTKFDINHLYLRANDRLTRILFDSLNSLKRRFLLDYNELPMIVRIDKEGNESHTIATDEEKALLVSIKYNVLADMKLNSITQVRFKFKLEEFYKRVNKVLNDKYDILYSYKIIELLFTKEDVLHELSLIEIKQNRKDLNNKVIDTINEHARDVYYKNEKEYNEGLMNFLLDDNEEETWGGEKPIEQFRGFRHKTDYIDIQLELAEYLLRIDD